MLPSGYIMTPLSNVTDPSALRLMTCASDIFFGRRLAVPIIVFGSKLGVWPDATVALQKTRRQDVATAAAFLIKTDLNSIVQEFRSADKQGREFSFCRN